MVSQTIPEKTLQEVLLRADIVEVLSDYVHLKKQGANYKGLCPFHTEKTPSFTVNPTKGLFYCFGCRAGGNVVGFLMQQDQLPYLEAVRLLAARYGVRMPETVAHRQANALQPLYRLYEAAGAFFHRALLGSAAARSARTYCRQRQITRQVVTRFGLGYAPASWDTLGREMQRQGWAEDLLIQSGLVVAREHQGGGYDRFRNRLIFPIHDRYGRPVAFGGRALEAARQHTPKYVNSPETPLFHKSRVLYGLHLAKQAIRQCRRAIIVEGYTDVIACHRHEVTHVIGTLGTALTERHVALLRGVAREVVLLFDGDAAGGAACERGIGLFLEAGMRVRIVRLPDGEDPDSFLRSHGPGAFLHQVDQSLTFLEYLLERTGRFYDMQTPAGRADGLSRILPLLSRIKSPVEQWGYVALLAEKVGVPASVLKREMGTASRAPGRVRKVSKPPLISQPAGCRPRGVEYDLLRLLLHDPALLTPIQHQVQPEDFQDPDLRDLFCLLVRLVSQERWAVFPGISEQVGSDVQRQLLAKMAAEPEVGSPEARRQALNDYLLRLRQRRMKTRRQQLKASLREAEHRDDSAEQQRLLQAYMGLR
ncbi:DNA primase [Candidatus Entotheonellaceae bacterium PAL068K]